MVTSWAGVRLPALDLLDLGESRDGIVGESVLTSIARDDPSLLKGLKARLSLTGVSSALLNFLPCVARLTGPASASPGVVARLSDGFKCYFALVAIRLCFLLMYYMCWVLGYTLPVATPTCGLLYSCTGRPISCPL